MNSAYICTCHDSGDAAVLRARHLASHLAYVETIMDKVLIAGALRDRSEQVTGSCLVYDVSSPEDALRLLRADPYYQAGVWERVECQQLSLAAGTWIGGGAW